eukprot:scaffold25090_cov57-Phaeocystis_antarctica.AAC.4
MAAPRNSSSAAVYAAAASFNTPSSCRQRPVAACSRTSSEAWARCASAISARATASSTASASASASTSASSSAVAGLPTAVGAAAGGVGGHSGRSQPWAAPARARGAARHPAPGRGQGRGQDRVRGRGRGRGRSSGFERGAQRLQCVGLSAQRAHRLSPREAQPQRRRPRVCVLSLRGLRGVQRLCRSLEREEGVAHELPHARSRRCHLRSQWRHFHLLAAAAAAVVVAAAAPIARLVFLAAPLRPRAATLRLLRRHVEALQRRIAVCQRRRVAAQPQHELSS